MKYISLFSGIEAATVAWQTLGWEPVAYAEIEPFPKAVLKHHYPNVPDLGDMTKVNWKEYHHAADVVVGGSPCQAFSIAGLRKALDDPRGQLMLEYLRACAEIDPEWIVWENVPGVLSAERGRAFQSLLEAVAELWPDGGGCMASAGRSVLRCGPTTRACVPCRQH
ncbi:DNA cytosine methyltransferase [Bifidobacterium adolescentis]|nr:DNA cytosine methyltransferase [Bifidobacterium adolescentis]